MSLNWLLRAAITSAGTKKRLVTTNYHEETCAAHGCMLYVASKTDSTEHAQQVHFLGTAGKSYHLVAVKTLPSTCARNNRPPLSSGRV